MASSVAGSDTRASSQSTIRPQLLDRCRQGVQLGIGESILQRLACHDSHGDSRRIGVELCGQWPRHQIRSVPVDVLQYRPFAAVLASAPRAVTLRQHRPGERQFVRVHHHPGSLG